jgi:hypothetical protein
MSEDLINTKVNAPTQSAEPTPKRTPRLQIKKKSLVSSSIKSDLHEMAEEKKSEVNEMEEICPFTNCGRKFVSSLKLKRHMEMRHMDEKLVSKQREEDQK